MKYILWLIFEILFGFGAWWGWANDNQPVFWVSVVLFVLLLLAAVPRLAGEFFEALGDAFT